MLMHLEDQGWHQNNHKDNQFHLYKKLKLLSGLLAKGDCFIQMHIGYFVSTNLVIRELKFRHIFVTSRLHLDIFRNFHFMNFWIINDETDHRLGYLAIKFNVLFNFKKKIQFAYLHLKTKCPRDHGHLGCIKKILERKHFIVLVMLDCKHFMLMLGHMCNSLLDIWGWFLKCYSTSGHNFLYSFCPKGSSI